MKGYSPSADQYTAVVAKWNQRTTSILVTSTVSATCKTISVTNATHELIIILSGITIFVFRPIPCHQHANWIVSDWGYNMLTVESRFALHIDDKHNQHQTITEHQSFRDGSNIDLYLISRMPFTFLILSELETALSWETCLKLWMQTRGAPKSY